MKRTSTLAVAALFVAAATLLPLPASAAGAVDMIYGWDIHHDTSAPMREIAVRAVPPSGFDSEIPIQEREGGKDLSPIPGVEDPAWQRVERPVPGAGPTPPPSLSVELLSEQDNRNIVGFSVVPPDTNGDVGLNYYVQWVNLVWAVYDKNTGARVFGPFAGSSFWDGFGGACQGSNDGDPIVMFDDNASRWVVSQFETGTGTQCVAVSTTSDPMGSYHRYAFQVTPGGLNDYPKLGIWDDGTTGTNGQSAYTFTTRDFTGPFNLGSGVMERNKMLAGQAAQFIKFVNPCTGTDCVEGLLPVHLDGPAVPNNTCPSYFAASDAQFDDDGPWTVDGYRNYSLCVNWNNIGSSTFVENPIVPSTPFDRRVGNGFSACVPSPGESLACLSIFTMHRAQARWFGDHASVVLNHTVDVNGNDLNGVRWAELRSANGQNGWTLEQDGTYSPDNNHRWMGSIAQDGQGNMALGYSVSNTTLNPKISYTSRMAGDPMGVMPGGEQDCHLGTGAQVSSANRWGDYSAMAVDPVDDTTFYYTTEYYQTTGSFDFKTRLCRFNVANSVGLSLDSIVPAQGGVSNDWNISGATPNGSVTVLCRPQGGGSIVNVGTTNADGNGDAVVTRTVPGAASGRTLECAARDAMSGQVDTIVQPFS